MKRILVVRTDRVGDVIMVTPMIRELRKTFPDAFIATLTQPYTKAIFDYNPHLDVALTDDLRKESFWDVVRELRKHKFTDGLLVLPTERAAYQMFLGGVRNRVGTGYKLYGMITFMKGVSRRNYTPLRHEADYCMDLARKIGVVTESIAPEMFLSDDEKQQALELLRRKGVGESDTKVFVHTGTGGSSPNWSEAKYLRLVKRILDEFDDPGVKIVLTAKEMTTAFLTDAMAPDPTRAVSIAGDIHDLREFIKVIGAADVIVTPSTGPAHIADALNVRTIALHCHRPMNCAKYWGVLNRRSINLEVPDEYCRTHCSPDQNTCAIEEGITVDEAIESVKTLLNESEPQIFAPRMRQRPAEK